ncbi:hypothetical protein F5Y15DRAFT_404948 [Xylariaceae sp. FL0016]|nr:hypothetical protein F5Y15DRAFT_404948 [Xylariaceae sp. FL0016]
MHAAVVNSWAEGPRCTTVDNPPPPSDDQLQLRVMGAGLHQLVRSRAKGQHYSASQLPHTAGVDGIGKDEATGKLYYFANMRPDFGSFVEYVNVDKRMLVALPDGADPVAFAAGVNPAMSSWMAITQRTSNLPENYTVLIVGATSASGKIAVSVARELGAGRVIGVARNAAALEKVQGLDERIVQKDPVTETDFSQVDCDVILDYIYGDVTAHLLSTIPAKRPIQYVQIGSMAQVQASLSAFLFRSKDITLRGSGPGAFPVTAMGPEMTKMIPKMIGWDLPEAAAVPLKDLETAWDDKELAKKGRIVFTP